MTSEEIIKTVTGEIAHLISTKTVIGEQITVNDRTIIPITKVSFGFGSGGGEGKKRAGDEGITSGGAGGATIQPTAFLVISQQDVQLFTITGVTTGKGIIEQLKEVLPDMMAKYKSITEEGKKEKPSGTGKETREDTGEDTGEE